MHIYERERERTLLVRAKWEINSRRVRDKGKRKGADIPADW
jgi:hypothetical protein